MSRKFFLLFFLLFLCVFAQSQNSFFVSTKGKDTNPGTFDKPFASLQKARITVRKQSSLYPDTAFNIYIREGSYFVNNFVLDSLDSGTEKAPVTYTAYKDELVSFTGGVSIDVQKAVPVKDASVLARLLPEVRIKILQVSLKELGIKDYGILNPKGFTRPYTPMSMELFCNGKPMILARWPNKGFEPMGAVLDPGSIPRNGDFSNRGGTFKFGSDRPLRWTKASDTRLSGFFCYGYADDAVKIAKLDTINKTFTTVQPHIYGFKSGANFQSWYAFNLLEEIDEPGEYFIDRENGILYFFPPDEAITELKVSVVEAPLFQLLNTRWVVFKNLHFEVSRGMGIYIEKGEGNIISHCTFRNFGQVAIMLGKGIEPFDQLKHAGTGKVASGLVGSLYNHLYDNPAMNREAGKNHLITNCTIYNTGSGAIILGGGNRITLEKGNNRVEYCTIHDFNRIERSYRSGINIDGVGNTIKNNEIYNCPGSAILLHGNDHTIEKNEIHHAVTDGDDMGAIYYGRDPSELGNKVINNFFHHIGNEHGMIMAVYHDDGACGMEVIGNVFYKAGSRTAMIGGGNNNKYYNNIFIDCPMAFHLDNRLMGWAKNLIEKDGLFEKRLKYVNYQQLPYSKAYPFNVNYFEDNPGLPKRNFIENNIFFNVPILHNGQPQWSYIGQNYFASDRDIFINYDKQNFQLKSYKSIQKILTNFKTIPFEEIGLKK